MKFNWNDAWLFTKDEKLVSDAHSAINTSQWEKVDLPHTWNAKDGQDGGNDYYRGTCYYTKKLALAECKDAEQIYIEFEGANSSADVYVNGTLAATYATAYGTFTNTYGKTFTEATSVHARIRDIDADNSNYIYMDNIYFGYTK